MAFLVSISSIMPLGALKFTVKEFQLGKVQITRLSSKTIITIATNKFLASNCLSRDFSSSVERCHQYLTPIDHFGELVTTCMNLSLCAQKVISGYWVGPDIDDDGWGFVEAYVDQIT